ncbi:hypothetical protein SDC9_175476 [bioreactor metagenome]|uniref:Uncharacterized protein n=1 Tax=bioreactor metagenome TaxID=1076179 RepID=A0A645GM91_9ZZZZ
MLLGVAQRRGDLGPLEHIAVDGQRDLGGADQVGDQDLDGGQVPAVGLCGETVDDGLDRDLLPERIFAQDERQHLLGRREQPAGVRSVEQPAVGVGCPDDLLLAVCPPVEQFELGVGAADQVLEAVGHPDRGVLGAGGDVCGVDDQGRLAHRGLDPLDQLLLAVDVLRALVLQDLALDGRDRGALLALDVLLGLDQQPQVCEHPGVRFEDDP